MDGHGALPPAAYDRWMDASLKREDLADLFEPFPSDRMLVVPVSRAVNGTRPRVNDASLLEPIGLPLHVAGEP